MLSWFFEHVYTVTENMKMFSIEEFVLQGVELRYLVRTNLIFFNRPITGYDNFSLIYYYDCLFILLRIIINTCGRINDL